MNIRIALGIIAFMVVVMIAVLMLINEWIKNRKKNKRLIKPETGM
jgi:hypothetical protein